MQNPIYAPLSRVLRGAYHVIAANTAQKQAQRYGALYAKTPLAPKTVLFETFWGRKIGCNPLAIYQGMCRDPRFSDYRFIWVTNKNTGIPEDIAQEPRTSFVSHQSKDYLEALASAGVLVNNTTFPTYFIRKPEQLYINTYHGVPLKKMGFDINDTLKSIANTQRNFLQATHLLSGGDYTDTHLFEPYGIMPLLTPAIEHTGYPRIDMSQVTATQAVRTQLGVSGTKPVVLYAPTWRGQATTHTQEINTQIKIVRDLSAKLSQDFEVVVSLHNLVLARAQDLPKDVRLLPADMDSNIAMSAVDILISDYSSILVDYLALDRPVVLFVPDLLKYQDERGLYLPLTDLPAAICTDMTAMIAAVKAARKPSDYPNSAQMITTLLPGQDGNSTTRTLDAILAPQEAAPVKKKRLLLAINALSNNGITTSLINLTRTIDYGTHEVFVLVDGPSIDRSLAQMTNFHKLSAKCHIILRSGAMSNSLSEVDALRQLLDPNRTPSDATYALAQQAYSREAKRLLGDTQFDIAVHFDGYSAYWAGLVAACNAQTKIICQHNDLYGEFTNPQKGHERLIAIFRTYKQYDLVAPVSQQVGDTNFKNLKPHYRNRDQVFVLRNTIDADEVLKRSTEPLVLSCPTLAQCADLPGLKIVTVGRLSPEKNHARLIRAFKLLRDMDHDATLFIAGAGGEQKKLEHLCAQLGVTDRVRFVGQLTNPYPFIKAADCFVLSSDYEGQPMTLLEALVLGTPCVGTDIPGIRAVLDGGLGHLARPTATGLAQALAEFATTSAKPAQAFDGVAYSQTVLSDLYQLAKPQNS